MIAQSCDTWFHNNKAKQTRSSKINSNKESSSNAEKMKKWREQKIAKKKEGDRKYYERNRERKIANVKEYKRKMGQTKVGMTQQSQQPKQKEFTAKKKKQEEKDVKEERKEKIWQQTWERVRWLREKRRMKFAKIWMRIPPILRRPLSQTGWPRHGHWRKQMKLCQRRPKKKAELFEAISSSPQTRKILQKKGIIKYPTEMKETMALCAPAADISEGADHVKKSRSKDKWAAFSAFKHLAFGQNVAKSKVKKKRFLHW